MHSLLKKLSELFGKKIPRANYLIEFRFHGYAKRYARELSEQISHKFHVKQVVRKGRPPHITLFGGFSCGNEKELVQKFIKICKNFDLIKFKLNDLGHIENKVIFIDVEPSQELKELRLQLAKELIPVCEAKEWDKEQEFVFHATLALKDLENKFDKIWEYLQNMEKPNIEQYLLRLTLLRNGKILKEYDFIQRRLLRRDEALSKKTLKTTIGYLGEIKENGRTRIIEENSDKVFLISDLHLDHENIIKYCHRPFKNAEEMNKTIVENWNSTVGKNDAVYFLGDMAFGKGSRKASYWIKQLNGKITFIEGNHEEVGNIKSYSTAEDVFLKYKGKEFLLVHDPALKPKNWDGWTIHGHKHNNHLEEFPFINGERKTINVSCELLDYKPINLNEIMPRLGTVKYWRTINDKPIKNTGL
ncbi:MAG: 2'-5' RNA ligase family protein [Candidatus Diapherotrites archaeon]